MARPAIGQQDDVAQAGGVVDEVVVGSLEPGEDVGVAVGRKAEAGVERAEIDRRRPNGPMCVLVERHHAELV